MKHTRLKFLANVVAGQAPAGDAVKDTGQLPFLQGCAEFGRETPSPTKYCDSPSKVAPIGSWLISVRAPVGRLNCSDQEYGIGRGLAAIVPERIDANFLGYALQHAAPRLSEVSTGSTYDAVAASDIAHLSLPDPNLATQKAIADFLDRETARIDQLIEKKLRLVDALKTKVRDFADLLVTGHNDPNRAMKSVSSPWLLSIPQDWKFKKAKHLFRQMDRAPLSDDGVITAFRDGQVCLRSRRRTSGFTFAILEVGYQHICADDLIIHSMDAFAGAIGVSEDDGKATGEYVVCTPRKDEANCEYFAHLLRCMARRDYIFVLCPSVRERAPRFRFVRFAPVLLPVPPREEQDRIVERIENETKGLNTVRGKTIVSLERLREYRAALITAAVTGQIDVQAFANSGTPDRRLDAIQEETGT